MSTPKFTVRVYNLPSNKTEEVIRQEFETLEIPMKSVNVPLRPDGLNTGYAIVEFDTLEFMQLFKQNFNVLRHDTVIYKNFMEI